MVHQEVVSTRTHDRGLVQALREAVPQEWVREGTPSEGARRRAQWEAWAEKAPQVIREIPAKKDAHTRRAQARNALCNSAARVMGTEREPDETRRSTQWDLIWEAVHGQGAEVQQWCEAEEMARRNEAPSGGRGDGRTANRALIGKGVNLKLT